VFTLNTNYDLLLAVMASLFFLLLCIPSLTLARSPRSPQIIWRRASQSIPPQGYYNPYLTDGSLLTIVPDTFPAGLGEPINTIITANSDADVLKDQQTDGGLRNYFFSFGFSGECLGQHAGSDQGANLGDGNGVKNETAVIRWNYGDAALGACKETIEGGNHFRYWVQNGGNADSGAIFMALSYELPIAQQHDIIVNGYNLARDYLVGNITNQIIHTPTLKNGSTYSGQTAYGGYTYQTNVIYVSGMLQNTSNGINHFATVGQGLPTTIDGLVAVLNVTITGRPPNPTGAAWRTTPTHIWILPPLISLTVLVLLPLLTSL
jgi:hypothetical protein